MPIMPVYAKVYLAIKNEIRNDVYSAGDLLPSEPELCARFGVSRITVRHAIELLAREGYIEVRQGRGTTVLDHRMATQSLNTVTSITETLRQKGCLVQTRVLSMQLITPPERIVRELALDEGGQVLCLHRVQLANAQPIAIMKNYLSPDMGPGMEFRTDRYISLYRFLEEHYGIFIDEAKDQISAKNASPREAELLEVPEQTALIDLHRIGFMRKRPVIIDQVYILGDSYRYECNISGRQQLQKD